MATLFEKSFMQLRVMAWLLTLGFLFSSLARASEWVEKKELGQVFKKHEAVGTFVYYDSGSNKLFGYDAVRAAKRFVPASTYKIPHSMIALSTGAVKSPEDIIPYDGKSRAFKQWERDMSLSEAVKLSNAAAFQIIAKRIGMERMQAAIRQLGYGNMNLGEKVDRFWLDGPLEISAIEQVLFLHELDTTGCGYPMELVQQVKKMVLIEEGLGWKLYAKSGWQNAPDTGTGWWVGWVTNEKGTYPFALNMDVKDMNDAKKRELIARECLGALGLMRDEK